MKLLHKIVPFLLLLPALARGGTLDSGGGGAYLCPDALGAKYSMLVDLWEAENSGFDNHGSVHVNYFDTNPAPQFAAAMKRLGTVAPELAIATSVYQDLIFKDAKPLPANEVIPIPPDLQLVYAPKGCTVSGMMYYDSGAGRFGQLEIDQTVFGELRTKTDVAAAWAHEAVYKIFREVSHQVDSRLTRRLVGCIFSDSAACLNLDQLPLTPADVAKSVKPGSLVLRCQSDDLDVSITPNLCDAPNADDSNLCDTGIKELNQLPRPGYLDVHVHGIKLRGGSVAGTIGNKIAVYTPFGNVSYQVMIDQTNKITPSDLDLPRPAGDPIRPAIPSGPLSPYGYVANAHVDLQLDQSGKIWVTHWRYGTPTGGIDAADTHVECVPEN